MAEARINLAELVYAKSTAASKEAKGKLFVQIAEARNLQPFPITPEVTMEVAAVPRAADFSSGFQYLMEAKQLHIRMGHPWPENLVAGRLAKTLTAKEQTCDEMTVCLKCKPDLIADWSRQAA